MKEIAEKYLKNIRLSKNIGEKQAIAAEFHLFYNSLTPEKKVEMKPFFEELRQNMKKRVENLDDILSKTDLLNKKEMVFS